MLTEEQASAAAAIDGGTPGFRAILLDGVTGSGKTEVYFAAMQAALEAARQVLLLVPVIGLTPQTLNRIRGRFDVPLAVLHSALAEGARMESWRARRGPRPHRRGDALGRVRGSARTRPDRGRRGTRRVIQAAGRLSIFSQGPCGETCEAAGNAGRARFSNAIPRIPGECTRASLCPRVPYPARREGPPPDIGLIDIGRHGDEDGLSPPLIAAMAEHLNRGEQILVFINRRGFAPVLMCRSCAWIADCPRCDAAIDGMRARKACAAIIAATRRRCPRGAHHAATWNRSRSASALSARSKRSQATFRTFP